MVGRLAVAMVVWMAERMAVLLAYYLVDMMVRKMVGAMVE
jgi:hypothetical protein